MLVQTGPIHCNRSWALQPIRTYSISSQTGILIKPSTIKLGNCSAVMPMFSLLVKIIHIKTVEQKKGKRLVATFKDETGEMELVWFRGQKWIRENLKLNTPYVIFGRCNWYSGKFSMPHPEMELLTEHEQGVKVQMQPVYPSTEKLGAIVELPIASSINYCNNCSLRPRASSWKPFPILFYMNSN